MKKLLGIAVILLSTAFIGYSQDDNSGDDVYYQDDQSSDVSTDNGDNTDAAPTYQTFYDQLSPYGSWINYPGYGYCWIPNNMDPGFSPYMTNGNWAYTDLGWTWVSGFAWGWGPFHYGRWLYDPNYGWIWIPGYDWAPAWVIWGDYGGYYGWACLGPHDVLSPHFRPKDGQWNFVDHKYMGSAEFGSHIVGSDAVAHGVDINKKISIISHANTYKQSVFFRGPDAKEVEKYTGQKVVAAKINNVHDPAQTKAAGNQINIYRPAISRTSNQKAAPAKVTDATPANNNNTGTRTNAEPQENSRQSRSNNQSNRPSNPNPSPPRESAPSQPQRTFVPSSRPSYSAPSRGGFGGGGSFGGGGGGSRGGGGGRR